MSARSQKFPNRFILMSRILFAAFFLSFLPSPDVTARSVPTAEPGGTLVVGTMSDPSNLIPILASDSASQQIVGHVFNGLLKYNPDLELEGDLAESWEILNEGKTIIFHLKKNVLWHDLKPLTAKDVDFTYQKLIDPDIPSPYRGDFEKVSSLRVIDNYTIEVQYKEAFSPGLASWVMWIMPKHLLENENFSQSTFARNPIGSGPFRFKRWVTGEKVELVAFEEYFEGRPRLDRLVYRVIPDPTTMFLELHSETVDQMGLTPLQFTRLTQSSFFQENFSKFKYPSFGYTYLGFNLKNPLFEDLRVRRAIRFAINKQEVIDGVLMGLGRQATGPFTPESWAYNADLETEPYNPKKALQLLDEAGWRDTNGDGLLDRDGDIFEFTIVTNQGNTQRKDTAEIIQKRLMEIGIRVKIKIIEWSAFLKEVVEKRKFDTVLLGWGLARDPDPYDIWHSSKTRPGEFNFISFQNDEVDALIDEGRATFDLDQRRRIYHAIHERLYQEVPCVFLFIPDALPIVHQRIENVEVTPIGLGYNFIDWEIRKENRKYTRFEL